jgi:hypothetical protein
MLPTQEQILRCQGGADLHAQPVKSVATRAYVCRSRICLVHCIRNGHNQRYLERSGARRCSSDKNGPPMVARAMAVLHTCIFDAWAAYDRNAVGTQLAGSLRRPAAERTSANKQKAISFAADRALADLFPGPDQVAAFQAEMVALGYDPGDNTTDTRTPQGTVMSLARLSSSSGTRTDPTNWPTSRARPRAPPRMPTIRGSSR